MRYARYEAPSEFRVRIKEIVPTWEEADAEAKRLNKFGKAHYFVAREGIFRKGGMSRLATKV